MKVQQDQVTFFFFLQICKFCITEIRQILPMIIPPTKVLIALCFINQVVSAERDRGQRNTQKDKYIVMTKGHHDCVCPFIFLNVMRLSYHSVIFDSF